MPGIVSRTSANRLRGILSAPSTERTGGEDTRDYQDRRRICGAEVLGNADADKERSRLLFEEVEVRGRLESKGERDGQSGEKDPGRGREDSRSIAERGLELAPGGGMTSMIIKVYHGDVKTRRVFVDKYAGNTVLEKERYLLKHIVRHSPTGFLWGYGGSGPADLALSILTDALISKGMTEAEKAKAEILIDRIYQDFKWEKISRPSAGSDFELDEMDIKKWVDEKSGAKAILEKDNFICQLCGKRGGTFHAHHIFPVSKYPLFIFNIDNGKTLCKKCHSKLHKGEYHEDRTFKP